MARLTVEMDLFTSSRTLSSELLPVNQLPIMSRTVGGGVIAETSFEESGEALGIAACSVNRSLTCVSLLLPSTSFLTPGLRKPEGFLKCPLAISLVVTILQVCRGIEDVCAMLLCSERMF